jgi:CopG family nickel-responsive transcriptional regulator
MSGITRFGVSIDSQLGKKFDEHIKRKGYSTRSEAIRDMIRDTPVI